MSPLLSQILDLPDSPGELTRFLEHALFKPSIFELVEQLRAVHGSDASLVSLTQALGSKQAAAMEQGLTLLSREQLRFLLAHPGLLLDLRQAVLSGGGEYWDNIVSADPSLSASAARVERRLKIALAIGGEITLPSVAAVVAPASAPRPAVGPIKRKANLWPGI